MNRNQELATLFQEMATALELTGANPFRVAAHSRVARALESMSEDAAALALADRTKLTAIEGVGDASARKMEEFARTGRIEEHQELMAQIPRGLLEVLQARLDGLPRPERETLQQASVIGHVFWDRALATLDARAPEVLPALVRRELALPHDEAAADDLREFAFSHKILHDVTYDTVLKRRRRALHARVARWLAARSGARAGEWLAAAAEHFALAGDAAQAAEYFARAAEHARSRFAHDAALAHAARALALLDGPNKRRQRLHYLPPSTERTKERSRTFQGIADAMAKQWG